MNVHAYIDGANLHKGVSGLGWELDYARFRVWLTQKYGVTHAYLFIGMIQKYAPLYTQLSDAGFSLVFKETTFDGEGKVKGNCDALLVLKVVVDCFEQKYDKAVIVSSDGDYAELLDFLKGRSALRILISPSNKCSHLLRKRNPPLLYLDLKRNSLQKQPKKENSPTGT